MTRSSHLHKADRWLRSQLASHSAVISVMARPKKALPEVGETSKILKADLKSVERSSFLKDSKRWTGKNIPDPVGRKDPHPAYARKQQIPGMASV